MSFEAFVIILLGAAIVNNYVLRQFLGICPFLGVSKEIKGAVGMSIAVAFVMVVATIVTWPIHTFLLQPNGLEFLQTVAFVLVIASIVQFIEFVMRKYLPALYGLLGVYLPLMATNCAIFAVTITNIGENHTFVESLVNALGSGTGFFLAMVLFSGIRKHIENSSPPESFKGIPLTLIAAAILSLTFFGFQGVAEGIFS